MRVVVIGATGNVGTSVLGALSNEPVVDSILGIARRAPDLQLPKVEWAARDIASDDVTPLLRSADAVVHLAWAIQPSHRVEQLHRTNVLGSRKVFAAVAEAGVRRLVYASSIGAYSPSPKSPPVDERWPTGGIHSSTYSMQKAKVERLLDDLEEEHPEIRSVRLRPALIFKGDAATEIQRYFLGALAPTALLRARRVPLVPSLPRLRVQAVHATDVAEAYRLAVVDDDAHGAFNIASEPVLDSYVVARLLRAHRVPFPMALLRPAVEATWHLRLQPTAGGWVDMGIHCPIMRIDRARTELGWKATIGADAALRELMEGLAHHRDWSTPPLQRA